MSHSIKHKAVHCLIINTNRKGGFQLKHSIYKSILGIVLGMLAITAAASPNMLVNLNFDSRDTSWNTLFTRDGSLGDGFPIITSFNTTGLGASNALKFQVGQFSPLPNIGQIINPSPIVNAEGGGIYLYFNSEAGVYDFAADVAVNNLNTSTNREGGIFYIKVDDEVVSIWDSGKILSRKILRNHLSGSTILTSGSHKLQLVIKRPYLPTPQLFQFVDNFTAVTAIPEPNTYVMFLAGLCLINFAVRRKWQ